MILLEDNREALYQWDLNQRLILIDIEAGTEVQISDSNNTDEYCLTSKAYNENGNVYAKIPNIYLQKSGILYVYIYVYQEDKSYTKYYTEIIVLPRKKPSNYIYTETEKYTVSEMLKDALEEAKASGEFKGEKGEPGEDAPQESVLYTSQSLTDEQQSQARENIAAAGVARIEAVETALAGKLDNAPGTWPVWTADEQAAARERMGASKGTGTFEDIATITITEEASAITINADSNGKPFSLSDIICEITLPLESPTKQRSIYFGSKISTDYTFSRVSLATNAGYITGAITYARIVYGRVISEGAISGPSNTRHQPYSKYALFNGYGGIKAESFDYVSVFTYSGDFPAGTTVALKGTRK